MTSFRINIFVQRFLLFFLVVIFSIFIGSQITEGILLVPYWQSLSSEEFYKYYSEFGSIIGRFYTLLTIIAAIIPIVIVVYCKINKFNAVKFALVSSFLALLFVSSFYIYFKGANELFYQAVLSDAELKKELITWSYWHWSRVFIEFLSLVFLIITMVKIPVFKNK